MVAFFDKQASTSPRQDRERLMFCVSCCRWPSDPDSDKRSLLDYTQDRGNIIHLGGVGWG